MACWYQRITTLPNLHRYQSWKICHHKMQRDWVISPLCGMILSRRILRYLFLTGPDVLKEAELSPHVHGPNFLMSSLDPIMSLWFSSQKHIPLKFNNKINSRIRFSTPKFHYIEPLFLLSLPMTFLSPCIPNSYDHINTLKYYLMVIKNFTTHLITSGSDFCLTHKTRHIYVSVKI